ncbi:MAG: hypothetical protein HQ568_03855 [Calditrichaeota bacterium]|nr:hypothetical protein [Calditrichota bacterium]
MPIDNRKDILLLLLYSPGSGEEFNEPIVGRTRLIKILFLFKKEALKHFKRNTNINEDNFYEFFPWDFGPFSTEVYDDLMFFQLRGFIETSLVEEDALPESAEEWAKWIASTGERQNYKSVQEYDEVQFYMTEKGQQFIKPLFESLSQSQISILKEFKKKLASSNLNDILRYVYRTYPETAIRTKLKVI